MADGQYAMLVDAGYLYACAGRIVLQTTVRRDFRVDTAGFVAALVDTATERLGGRLLRVYWFDAAKDRIPTLEQRAVAQLEGVKLRLGNLNQVGQQKGVDAQIRADLEALGRNHAVTDAILLAGDEDMLPAIEAAQSYGVRLHLWGIEPPYGSNQAERLVWEADTRHQLDEEFCRPFVHRAAPDRLAASPAAADRPSGQSGMQPGAVPRPGGPRTLDGGLRPTPLAMAPAAHAVLPIAASTPVPAAPAPAPAPSVPAVVAVQGAPGTVPAQVRAVPLAPDLDLRRVEEIGEAVAHRWLFQRGRDNLGDLLTDAPRLPTLIDRDLLVEAESELGTTLRGCEEARRKLRDGFWARLYREFGPDEAPSAD